jgi:phage protein D
MVEICRILEQAAPPVRPSSLAPDGGRFLERTAVTRQIIIGGSNLQDEALSGQIRDIIVEETSRGLSMAKVVLNNTNLAFTDHELLQGGSVEVEIFNGYANTVLEPRGVYRAAVPKYAFGNMAMPTIELICFGPEWCLAAGERREVYENLRDSEIAERIAQQAGLESDVEQTDPIYEHVAQFNMTDMEFLETRALLYGYNVYVEEGVLHFHPPRFVHSGLTLFYGGGDTGVLTSFEVTVDPWVLGSIWTKSGINRVTGEEWEFTTSDPQDEISMEIQRKGGRGYQTAGELAKVDGVRPTRYIVGDGHELSEDEGSQQADSYAKATEWIVVGAGSVKGIELLHARQVVTILGVGHLSGDYYVTGVDHKIMSTGYTMDFTVTRPGLGKLDDMHSSGKGDERRDVTGLSSEAGTAELF